MTSAPIRLLVSVRNADEAMHAIHGGADIVDVKEPLNGSLGRASAEALDLIARRLRNEAFSFADVREPSQPRPAANLALSVALGEVTEWLTSDLSLQREYASALQSLQPQFLKVGLCGLAASRTEWSELWKAVRAQFNGTHRWVAVAYADHLRATAPEPPAILEAGEKAGCTVLLIDTFEKDGSTLLDWLTIEQIRSLRVATQRAGMRLALAGRITLNELPELLAVGPNIVAVRGAVCTGGERTSSVDPDRVRAFAAALR